MIDRQLAFIPYFNRVQKTNTKKGSLFTRRYAAQLREMAPLKNQKKIQQNTQEKTFPDFRYNMKSNSTLVQLDNRE